MKYTNLLFSIAFALLLGCGAKIVYYKSPTGSLEQYSKITIKNTSSVLLGALLYENPTTCANALNFDPELNKGASFEGGERTAYAKKGEYFTVMGLYDFGMRAGAGGLTTTSCELKPTLIPTADNYVIEFGTSAEGCGVSAYGYNDGDSSAKAANIVLRKYRIPFFQDGDWCHPLTEDDILKLNEAE
jgi:hypothetical protein